MWIIWRETDIQELKAKVVVGNVLINSGVTWLQMDWLILHTCWLSGNNLYMP